MLKKFLVLGTVVGALVILFLRLPGKYDGIADCLSEKGAAVYGSNLCPSCAEQKALFGSSFRRVNYVNCDTRPEECIEQGIYALPTWIINGERIVGVRSLKELASAAGCAEGG